MASYSSVDFALSKRRMPRSQVESIPDVVDDAASDDGSSHAGSVNPGSLRANFFPPGVDFGEADEEASARYGSFRDASPFFSPVFSNLPSVDPRKLREASDATQAVRRKLMRGSNILIIQGGYSGKKFIYERLRELGVHVTIMDGPDTIWRAEAEKGTITEFIPLDFTDNETVFARAMDAIEEDASKFDALTSFFEDAIPLVARMAAALGLECNPVSACEIARNKRKSRQVMAEHSLPVPKYLSITAPAHVAQACDVVGFPAIIKPVYGAASLGVVRVETLEEAQKAYKEIIASLRVEEDTIWAQGKELVMEEYYDGEEFDIDILLSDGKCVYAKVSDNWECMAPWFQELGTNCPSLYPPSRQDELIKLSVDTTLAFGFRSGCFHVECKYTARGPRMIEVNARMGGVSVRDANLIAWGVDLVEEHAMSALRIPIAPVVPARPLKFMAETCINCPYSGTMTSDTWLDHGRSHPGVLKIEYMKKRGAKVVGADRDVPAWLAEVIVVSDVSQEHAIDVVRQIVEQAGDPPIEPDDGCKRRPFYFPSDKFPFVRVAAD
jgi:biotin carboxylase